MKKFLIILLTIALSLPLYAQEGVSSEVEANDEYTGSVELMEPDEDINVGEEDHGAAFAGEQSKQKEAFGEDFRPDQQKKEFVFARQLFELGFDVGAGLDNDLMAVSDFFQKNIVLDLDKVEDLVGDDGLNLNLVLAGGLFINVKNIDIQDGIWDFGFFAGADGNIHGNMPQSLFTLISQGNIHKHSFEGMISASGGIYANAGLRASAKYGDLRLGVKPALFAPIVFIPKSGIKYELDTEEGIWLTSSGEINIYSPLGEDGQFTGLQFGFDMSLEGEYNLFSFLDVGGSFSRIPIAPANMKNRMKMTMADKEGKPIEVDIKGEDFLEGKDVSEQIPDFDSLEFDTTYDTDALYKVRRPMRFDVYARYKPFNTEILAVVPNLGFSVDINEKQGYFNAGLEVQTNVKDLFYAHLGTGCEEAVWKHRFGLALNLRAFEWGIEAALRSQNFAGSFKAQGFGVNTGIRFGW